MASPATKRVTIAQAIRPAHIFILDGDVSSPVLQQLFIELYLIFYAVST